jgi:acyl-CoA thioester hydrolase
MEKSFVDERSEAVQQTSIPVRVAFQDVDASGRIHFTAMLRYMDIAEHELRRSIGFPQAITFPDIVFPRVHVECDFRGAIRYDDQLAVDAQVERVGRSSWTVAFVARLTRAAASEGDGGGEERMPPLVAEGRMTMVAMDAKTERAIPLPDELRSALVYV